MTQLRLIDAAQLACDQAYAPYSRVAKGAAIESADGAVYAAGNLEFATYGGSVCAEIAALSAAINDGKRQFKLIALSPYRYPCGNCRQALSEFGLSLTIVTKRDDGNIERRTLAELLPESFGKGHLGGDSG